MRAPIGLGYLLNVVQRLVLSTLLVCSAGLASSHELRPAIADLAFEDQRLSLEIEVTLEALLAGIDMSTHDDTTDSPEAADYDRLRAEAPAVLTDRLEAAWPEIAKKITLKAGDEALSPQLNGVDVPPVGDTELPRDSLLIISADLPNGADEVEIGWDASFGPLVLRQIGVEDGYSTYLDNGTMSDPIPRAGGVVQSGVATFIDYVVIGFAHIIPKGLDHILFVLGLFFLSLNLRPLLWQVSAFTVAHTITLALGILGIVTLPASVVEPLIAASIVYVGVENVLSKGLTPWRPIIVFLFGLLHGLGFASVLGDIGLSPGTFVTSLIGFNVGVELGQLAVIAVAFLTVGLWFGRKSWYRSRIANPASIAIALVGAWWVVERTLL
jgi:hypothetical protein